MRFVFDENHPAALARMIAPLAESEPYEVTDVVQSGLRGRADAELLTALGELTRRNVLIITDRAMKRRRHERAAVASTGAVVEKAFSAGRELVPTLGIEPRTY